MKPRTINRSKTTQYLLTNGQFSFASLRESRHATEEDVAQVIFAAATDNTDQLRYVATDDIKPWVSASVKPQSSLYGVYEIAIGNEVVNSRSTLMPTIGDDIQRYWQAG